MQTLEFETYIKNGEIILPEQFKSLSNQKVKVIIFFDNINNYENKFELIKAFKQAQNKGIFSNIDNSVEWQKSIRNEWE